MNNQSFYEYITTLIVNLMFFFKLRKWKSKRKLTINIKTAPTINRDTIASYSIFTIKVQLAVTQSTIHIYFFIILAVDSSILFLLSISTKILPNSKIMSKSTLTVNTKCHVIESKFEVTIFAIKSMIPRKIYFLINDLPLK